MDLVPGKQAAERIGGMINPKYQVHAYCVHLTVRNIYSVDPVGQIDFSGSEYVPAGKLAIESRRLRPEDRYEWWDLGRGSYFVELNETLELAGDEIALLEPEERLLRAGAMHAPMFLRGRVAPVETLLHVEALQLQIKCNARVSRVWVFRMAASKSATQRPYKTPKKKPARR